LGSGVELAHSVADQLLEICVSTVEHTKRHEDRQRAVFRFGQAEGEGEQGAGLPRSRFRDEDLACGRWRAQKLYDRSWLERRLRRLLLVCSTGLRDDDLLCPQRHTIFSVGEDTEAPPLTEVLKRSLLILPPIHITP